MKKTMTALALASFLGTGVGSAVAGCDDGWATAGKILTGFVAGQAVAHAFSPPPVYYPAVVYSPPPVYVVPPIYVRPAPVYVQSPPVVYAPPPVVYAPAVPVCRPAPVISLQFGFGHSHHRPLHHHPYPRWR